MYPSCKVHSSPFLHTKKNSGETSVFRSLTFDASKIPADITNTKSTVSFLVRSNYFGFVQCCSIFKNSVFVRSHRPNAFPKPSALLCTYPLLIAFSTASFVVPTLADQCEHLLKNRGFPLRFVQKKSNVNTGPERDDGLLLACSDELTVWIQDQMNTE